MNYLYGILNLSFWQYVLALMFLTQMTIASVTLYLHRYQSHRAIELHSGISHVFRFWLWLTTGTITEEWVAVHRKHHAFTETENDPHSPVIYGINKVLWDGITLYRAECRNRETIEKYNHGTPNDWIERHLYSKHSSLGLALLFVLDLVLFGIPGITIWAIQMLWIPLFAGGVINGIGHYFGYRNYECPDASRNIVPFGIFVGGEELHNNHHAFASSAKLSSKWWEIDMGWWWICTLSFLRLATIKKVPPKLAVDTSKTQIDLDTLKAVVINRYQVMSVYAKEVVYPVFNQERRKAELAARNLFTRARSLLIREESLMSVTAKQRLEQLLANQSVLNSVYQYRLRLQEIWSSKNLNQSELIEALSQWCKQAEVSRIEALERFATKLRSFMPTSAFKPA